MGSEPGEGGTSGRRWARLIGIALAAVALITAAPILQAYVGAIPRTYRRRGVDLFLQALLVAHGLLLVAAPAGTIVAALLLIRARRRRERRPALARGILLGASCLIGLGLVEASAAAWRAWTHRLPSLPGESANGPARAKKAVEGLPDLPVAFQKRSAAGESEPVEVVVIGESSARGEPYGDPQVPYTPWLSIGQVVAWQLQKAIPGRRFHATVLAVGGDTLEMQHKRLAELERRPDVLIVYAGHNEFHSRYNWERTVPRDEVAAEPSAASRHGSGFGPTPLGRMIREAIARNGVEVAPPQKITRQLVDWPVCTPEERAELLADFGRRLDAIAGYAERVGALPVLVIPAGNDAGYEPNRSIAVGRLSRPAVAEIARAFEAARAAEAADPAEALSLYRAFLARQPKFAEAHYRVARLLERAGQYEEANRAYILARDLDGFPQRCPSDFQDAYRTVAARHPSSILVDGQAVLGRLSRHGILDDNLFHDGQHPVLIGHVALAQAVLDGLHARGAFGWPEKTPSPRIDPAECAEQFGMNANRWAIVCGRVIFFYKRTAYLRHDPSHRLAIIAEHEKAEREIRAGKTPEETGIPGLGVRPVWKDDPWSP